MVDHVRSWHGRVADVGRFAGSLRDRSGENACSSYTRLDRGPRPEHSRRRAAGNHARRAAAPLRLAVLPSAHPRMPSCSVSHAAIGAALGQSHRLRVDSSRAFAAPSRLRLAGKAPRVFSHQLFHGVDLHGLPSDDALHLRVLSFQLLEPGKIAGAHASVL